MDELVLLNRTVKIFYHLFQNGEEFRAYMAESSNNTWSQAGNDIFLTNTNRTLIGGVIDVSGGT